jgi:hypothetical protein
LKGWSRKRMSPWNFDFNDSQLFVGCQRVPRPVYLLFALGKFCKFVLFSELAI